VGGVPAAQRRPPLALGVARSVEARIADPLIDLRVRRACRGLC
jgi:hypothetical protein